MQQEISDWEFEKQFVESQVLKADEGINLDIGGTQMRVSKMTLCSVKGSLLEKMFCGKHELTAPGRSNRVYLDRNPKAFEQMINYLRSGRSVYPQFETM